MSSMLSQKDSCSFWWNDWAWSIYFIGSWHRFASGGSNGTQQVKKWLYTLPVLGEWTVSMFLLWRSSEQPLLENTTVVEKICCALNSTLMQAVNEAEQTNRMRIVENTEVEDKGYTWSRVCLLGCWYAEPSPPDLEIWKWCEKPKESFVSLQRSTKDVQTFSNHQRPFGKTLSYTEACFVSWKLDGGGCGSLTAPGRREDEWHAERLERRKHGEIELIWKYSAMEVIWSSEEHSQCCLGGRNSAVWLGSFVCSLKEVLQCVSTNWSKMVRLWCSKDVGVICENG